MQIKFTPEQRTLVSLLLNDIMDRALQKKNKAFIKYAKKIQNQFDVNSEITNIKVNDLKAIFDVLTDSITIMSNHKGKCKENDAILDDNILIAKEAKQIILDSGIFNENVEKTA